MMKWLEDLRVDRIDFVPKGASIDKESGEGAHILLFKRDTAGDIEKAETKTEDGVKFPAAAFAFVPDVEKPSTWKLRIWETVDKKVTRRQVGMAVAALGIGFRGNKVSIPPGDLKKVKARVRAAWKSVHGEDDKLPPILKTFEESMDARRKDRQPFEVIEEIMDATNALQSELISARDRFGESGGDDASKVKKAKDALAAFGAFVKAAIPKWMKGEPVNKSTEVAMERKFELTDVENEDVRDHIEKLESEVAESAKKIEELSGKPAASAPGDKPDVLKAAPLELRTMIENLEKKATDAESIAKRLEDEQELREMIAVCKGWGNISVDMEVVPAALKRLRKSDPAGYEAIRKQFDSANSAAKVTKEIGSYGDGAAQDGTAYLEAIALARGLVSKGEVKTEHDALEQVFRDNEPLYERYCKENSVRIQ